MHYLVGGVVGLCVGIFCPSVARKLHNLFSKGVAEGATLAGTAVQDLKKKL